MKTISIVVPTYNEEENIIPLVTRIRAVFDQDAMRKYRYEILFTDNKSADRTREIIETLAKEDKRIKAIFNVRNFKGGSAMNGLRSCTGDCAVFMAADLQDPPEELNKFIAKWENGAKIVVGIKNKSQTNFFMHKFRSLYYKLMRKMSDIEQIEQFASYALYDRSFLNVLRQFDDPRPYLRGIVCELGGDIERVEYVQEKRAGGKSSQNFLRLFDFAMIGITSYTKTPIRLATFSGAAMLVISTIIALVYFFIKIFHWNQMPIGIAPIIILICIFGSLNLFFLGLIGEYILNINIRTMKHPTVVEEKRINFDEDVPLS